MISRRRWALIGSIGPFIQSRSNWRLSRSRFRTTRVLLAIEPEHVVAVEVQQPLELGDQAVDPQRGDPGQAGQRGGRDRPALAVERRQDRHDDRVLGRELADHLPLGLVGRRRGQVAQPGRVGRPRDRLGGRRGGRGTGTSASAGPGSSGNR